MTAYDAIKLLIEEKLFTRYEDAWWTIMNAYNNNKIDGDELVELAKSEGIELSDVELEGMAGGLSWGDGDCSLFEEDCSDHCYADYR